MTLQEAAPYFPVVKVKPDRVELCEILDRDPSQMTIGELHKHRFYLETEILKSGPDTCTICRIVIGSVVIVWQIHVDHVYQAYSRLKRLPSQPQLHAIRFISIPEAERWEGLPFLWHGQDVDEIGPIESSPCVRQDPYPLPQEFEWSTLTISNTDEMMELYKDAGRPISIFALRNHVKWLTSTPLHKKWSLLGIKLSSSKKLVGMLFGIPYHIRVGRKVLPFVHLVQVKSTTFSTRTANVLEIIKQENQTVITVIKETMRILAHEGIFQATLTSFQHSILKTVATYDYYVWDSHLHSLPYTAPRTVGLRRMKPSDVPKALALTNQYTSQFEIAQVFQSEEEFSHWFLNPLLDDDLVTYVVEESNSGNITDMFSFNIDMGDVTLLTAAKVTALVITKAPAKQLITDLILCAKQQSVLLVLLPRFGLKEQLFKDFCAYGSQKYCTFYNYKYLEVDDNICLFEHF